MYLLVGYRSSNLRTPTIFKRPVILENIRNYGPFGVFGLPCFSLFFPVFESCLSREVVEKSWLSRAKKARKDLSLRAFFSFIRRLVRFRLCHIFPLMLADGLSCDLGHSRISLIVVDRLFCIVDFALKP